ncbi:MAG: YihY/virulence factor BrkB family protein [Myxococcaceae bacterium]
MRKAPTTKKPDKNPKHSKMWTWWLDGMSVKEFGKSLSKHYKDHATSDTSAQLSYYFLLALFPFLFALVTLAAFLPIHSDVNAMLARLSQVMPSSAFSLVQEHLTSLVNNKQPHLLTIGLVSALWTASRGVDAFRKGLNLAYDVTESRNSFKTNAVALGMTVAGALLMVLGVAVIAVGGKLGFVLADKLHVGKAYAFAANILRWPVTAMIIMFAVALIYYALPDVKQRFKYITPGSVLATVMWLIATYGFTQYVEHFGKYNVTYGSIGGVVVLMLWLYYTGMIFLLGGEINAVLEHKAAPAGKEAGARDFGEKAPPKSQRPSFAPVGAAKSAKAADGAPNQHPPHERPKHANLPLSWKTAVMAGLALLVPRFRRVS